MFDGGGNKSESGKTADRFLYSIRLDDLKGLPVTISFTLSSLYKLFPKTKPTEVNVHKYWDI
jgi:hypothetical protein